MYTECPRDPPRFESANLLDLKGSATGLVQVDVVVYNQDECKEPVYKAKKMEDASANNESVDELACPATCRLTAHMITLL